MVSINDSVIVDALEEMANVMAQANEVLHVNKNQKRGVDEFHGLRKFQKNNPPIFKGRYDPEGAQTQTQEIEKNFRVMVCTDAQKGLFGPYMLSKEAEYWWENTLQRLEVVGMAIIWNNLKNKFLNKYFLADIRN